MLSVYFVVLLFFSFNTVAISWPKVCKIPNESNNSPAFDPDAAIFNCLVSQTFLAAIKVYCLLITGRSGDIIFCSTVAELYSANALSGRRRLSFPLLDLFLFNMTNGILENIDKH